MLDYLLFISLAMVLGFWFLPILWNRKPSRPTNDVPPRRWVHNKRYWSDRGTDHKGD